MSPEQARDIYSEGVEAVVLHLCNLSAQVETLEQTVEAQAKKIAELSKDSSNSSKRPSSDDITKPKGKKKTPGTDAKKNKIGG